MKCPSAIHTSFKLEIVGNEICSILLHKEFVTVICGLSRLFNRLKSSVAEKKNWNFSNGINWPMLIRNDVPSGEW
jgi:hypothetical protein